MDIYIFISCFDSLFQRGNSYVVYKYLGRAGQWIICKCQSIGPLLFPFHIGYELSIFWPCVTGIVETGSRRIHKWAHQLIPFSESMNKGIYGWRMHHGPTPNGSGWLSKVPSTLLFGSLQNYMYKDKEPSCFLDEMYPALKKISVFIWEYF